MAIFQSLAHRPFLLLWSGQTISRFGDSVYQIALAWWVLERAGSTAMGGVFMCAAIPTAAFALLGGVAVDRLPRAGLMLSSDALRGALAAAIAVLMATSRLEIWHIYAASTLFGLVNAVFLPAYTALIPDMTPKHLLSSTNALTSVSAEVAGVAGPMLGAYLIGIGGSALAFAFDSLSFLISMLCLLPLCWMSPPTHKQARTSAIRDLRAGIQTVLATPWLWMTIVILALLNLTGRSPVNVTLPFLVRDSLRSGADVLGLLYSAFSLGSIAGAVWVGRRAQLRRCGRLIYRALTVVGLATLALGLPVATTGCIIAIFVLGVGLAVGNLVWAHIVQEYVPAQVFGRVASIAQLGSASLLPIGFGIAGWATERLGPAPVFVICGAMTAAMAALGLSSRAVRELE